MGAAGAAALRVRGPAAAGQVSERFRCPFRAASPPRRRAGFRADTYCSQRQGARRRPRLRAGSIFALAKPVCLRFMAPAGLLAPSCGLVRVDDHRVPESELLALRAGRGALGDVGGAEGFDAGGALPLPVLRHPAGEIPIPTVLINQLFALSNQRILEFAILLPAVVSRVVAARRGQPLRLNGARRRPASLRPVAAAAADPLRVVDQHDAARLSLLLDTYLVYFAF